MKPWSTIAREEPLTLHERDGVFVVRSGGRELMSSARHHSEEDMARIGLEHVRAAAPTVLIGGLGLGYSVRAALIALPPTGRVVVAELSEAVVSWNRTYVAELAGRPLDDPRVEVAVDDVTNVLRTRRKTFDCVLLDVDNGPSNVLTSNTILYGQEGIALMKNALRPGGVLVVWSAGPDERFLSRLSDAGFNARTERSRARLGGSAAHVLFVGTL